MKTKYGARLGSASLFFLLISGCAALRPEALPHPSFYSLDQDSAILAAPRTLPDAAPALLVSTPQAAAGFDSSRIIYLRQPHQLEYFAHSEWIDTPARMLTPLLIAAMENSGTFRAVVHAPGPATGEVRLDSEILQLQHEFIGGSSQVRFVLRAYLVEESSRRVIATRQFEAIKMTTSEDPYGGVIAANQAVQTVLKDLAAFCKESLGK
ncbi:MAG: ABC-type transport auxiliary lipoprotein family protein [Gallionellaceae bacterium]|nr:ABC-type transport auxiliary lipoprotein family protein [Gallionellaceae bacterium]